MLVYQRVHVSLKYDIGAVLPFVGQSPVLVASLLVFWRSTYSIISAQLHSFCLLFRMAYSDVPN